ncbi:unnamed protein product [Rotaria magnacalcarata]|uniref:Uncharacterized protein n=2 Tax=Rotaria magnacalcarata TaxID=392030 RepID=A0A816QU77_9BILA|nr:unnamed protein product [Rotaria magnacalcarata]CAF1674666.1 unnamed protein product [Rotaria magnacalcarata]CAF2066350.1 unnamed protein product [Rotaria magnacalcarata]
MNINLNEPCRWLSDSTDAENEIRQIFYNHWEKLKDHLIAGVNEINAWRQRLLDDINNYANEQIRVLAEDYERQRLSLDVKREENLDTTRAYCGIQSVDLFTELHNACQSIEFQVAQLESINVTMRAIKVITISEQIERNKIEKIDTTMSDNDQNKPIIEHTNDINDNTGESRDQHIELASSITNETASHSLTPESSNVDSQAINSSRNSTENILNNDDSIKTCPICFMIFPIKMKHDYRSRHINEHCTDD